MWASLVTIQVPSTYKVDALPMSYWPNGTYYTKTWGLSCKQFFHLRFYLVRAAFVLSEYDIFQLVLIEHIGR